MTDFRRIFDSTDAGLKQYVQCLHRQAKKVAISIGEQPCWVSDLETGCFLATLSQDKDCLDIGTFTGFSAACMAIRGKLVHTYDIHRFRSKVWDFHPPLKTKITELPSLCNTRGPHGLHCVIKENNHRAILDRKYDLIYLDGGHWKEVTELDMAYYPDFLAPEGIMVCDDCNTEEVRSVVGRYTDVFISTPDHELGIYINKSG